MLYEIWFCGHMYMFVGSTAHGRFQRDFLISLIERVPDVIFLQELLTRVINEMSPLSQY